MSATASIPRVQVLVVDPDANAVDVIRGALPDAAVRRVDSVYEALAHVESHHVDVMVTERLLPGASCDDLLRRLERDGHDVPVIVCSHRRTPIEPLHPYVCAVLTKPVDPNSLRSVLLAVTAVAHA